MKEEHLERVEAFNERLETLYDQVCEFLKTSWQQHLSTREAFVHKNRSIQVEIFLEF